MSGRRSLSGSKRVLNDTVVNIHNTVESYKELILKGIRCMQKIQSDGGKVSSNYNNLGIIIREMNSVVQKLKVYSEQLSNLSELNKESPPPFNTWTYKEFSDISEEIYKSYKEETESRIKIAHSVYDATINQVNFLLISWSYTLFCINETKFKAMLHECGL